MSRITAGSPGNFSSSSSGGDGAIVDGVSSSIKATVLDLTSSDPLTVAVVDSNGDQITSFGGGTQYTEGDTDASITGTAILMEVAGNALQPVQGTVADGLLVNLGTNNDVSLNAGTNAIGKLAANSGVDIGDVDILSSALPTGASTSAKQDTIIGHVDGIEGLLTTIDGDTGNLAGDIDTVMDTVDGAIDGNSDVLDTRAVLFAKKPNATYGNIEATAGGNLKVAVEEFDSALPAGTNLIGKVSIDQVTANANEVVTKTGSVTTATLAAETTKVIGTVRIKSGGGTSYNVASDNADGYDGSGAMQAVGYLFNGTNYDRLRGDTTNGLDVDVTRLPALAAGTNAIGKLAANSGVDIGDVDVTSSALPTGASTLAEQQTQTTALQLIDNSIYVDDADWTADTSSHTLVGGVTQATPSANTDGDVTPFITNILRELRIAVPESDLATAATTHVKKYYTNSGAVTDGVIWSPAAGKRWFVTDLIINVSAAATVTLEDDKSGGDEAVMKFELAANSGISHSFKTPWFSGEDAADLIVTTSAGNVYITAVGYEI